LDLEKEFSVSACVKKGSWGWPSQWQPAQHEWTRAKDQILFPLAVQAENPIDLRQPLTL
jgi:hypothetical protein